MQASIGVPETTIGLIVARHAGGRHVPQVATPIQAHISEIGSAAGPGNVFPVKAALILTRRRVRAGMTAEVTLVVGGSATEASYFVPLVRDRAGQWAGEGFVFVYDPTSLDGAPHSGRSAGPLASNMVAVTGLNVRGYSWPLPA